MSYRFQLKSLISLLSVFLVFNALSAAAVELNDAQDHYSLTDKFSWYADPAGELKFRDIAEPQRLQKFKSNIQRSFNLGYVDYPVWFYVPLTRIDNGIRSEFDRAPWQIMIDYATLDLIDVYLRYPNGSVKHLRMGDTLPFDQRPLKHHNFIFPALIPKGGSVDLFIRVQTSSSMQLPLSAYSPRGATAVSDGLDTAYGVYFGVMAIMALYNLFIFVILKDRSYLYYVFHILSFTLLQAALSGYTFEYLWPNATHWAQTSIPLLINLTCFCSLIFARSFLVVKECSQLCDRLLMLVIAAVAITAPLYFSSTYKTAVYTSMAMTFATAGLIFGCGLQSLREGFRQARLFLLAWTAYLIGATVQPLAVTAVIPGNILTLHSGLIGSAIEVLMLSLALAERFNFKIRTSESVARDTSQKLYTTNQQLNDALLEQKRLVRVKDNFLAAISHELRTPMNGVEGALELIETGKLIPGQKRFIAAAKQSARDMTGKIDAILRFSEIQSGELMIKRERVEIRQQLNPLIDDARNKSMLKGLNLGFHIDRDVPTVIEGDGEQLVLVVKQLVDNAIKFTSEGQVQIFVTTGWDEIAKRKMLCISVIDTGDGMPPGQMTNTFNAFDQRQGPGQRSYGLGIGLTICKQLAELMSGELIFESTPGEGTECTFKLPLLTLPPEIRHEPIPDINIRQESKIVLVAEDNPVNQLILRSLLETMDCLPVVAGNGREVLEILESQPIDLIMMDCQMPMMDGFETTRAIRNSRRAYSNLPIIAVTANATSADSSRCVNAGMNDYIKKPIDRQLLEAKVKHWLKYGKVAAL